MSWRRTPSVQFILALAVSSLVSLALFLCGAYTQQNWQHSYLVWNLFLAWLPLLFAMLLVARLRVKRWSSWECLGLSFLWLLFLPNSFYMISDFIHLQEVETANVLYDVVMFTSFIYTGVALGFSSLYLIHLQLRRRLPSLMPGLWIALTLFLCSAAIFIGRDLRWNSWDILTDPGGLLFDIAYRLQHASSYPDMLLTVASFFILLGSMYGLIWRGANLLQTHRLK